jgi:hypothetical protein
VALGLVKRTRRKGSGQRRWERICGASFFSDSLALLLFVLLNSFGQSRKEEIKRGVLEFANRFKQHFFKIEYFSQNEFSKLLKY